MGHALTLDLPETIYQSLKRQAEQTGQSPEAFAIQVLTSATQHLGADPLEPFIGAFSSHGADWVDRHDAYLGQAIKDTMDHEASGDSPHA